MENIIIGYKHLTELIMVINIILFLWMVLIRWFDLISPLNFIAIIWRWIVSVFSFIRNIWYTIHEKGKPFDVKIVYEPEKNPTSNSIVKSLDKNQENEREFSILWQWSMIILGIAIVVNLCAHSCTIGEHKLEMEKYKLELEKEKLQKSKPNG